MHTQFVRSHVASGKEYVIGHDNQFIALHKERHVVPVSVNVTKISGIGEDMLFMGVVEVGAESSCTIAGDQHQAS
jgi:hypothetical protein